VRVTDERDFAAGGLAPEREPITPVGDDDVETVAASDDVQAPIPGHDPVVAGAPFGEVGTRRDRRARVALGIETVGEARGQPSRALMKSSPAPPSNRSPPNPPERWSSPSRRTLEISATGGSGIGDPLRWRAAGLP
jgi:hypothetical protein